MYKAAWQRILILIHNEQGGWSVNAAISRVNKARLLKWNKPLEEDQPIIFKLIFEEINFSIMWWTKCDFEIYKVIIVTF